MPASRRRVLSMVGVLALVSLAACEPLVAPVPVRSGRRALATVPAKGTSTSLDFATWTLEWFGDPANGPTNDALQLANARDVIAGADMDIWAFQEIVDSADFSALEAQLAGYTEDITVIGDWNDDVDTSISTGRASPYRNFVDATTTCRFPTKALSDAGISSTVSYADMIDHHLTTNEGDATYVAGSAEVYRVDQYIANYAATTSDHYPCCRATPSAAVAAPTRRPRRPSPRPAPG
jgi:hypothetical protein